MAEDFRISLRTEIGKGELENVRKQINGLKTTPINIELNFKDVQKQIDGIKKQLSNLGGISNNFVGSSIGGGDGVKQVKKQVDATLNAYKDLQKLQARINSTRFKIGGLDSKKNSSEITTLNTQLNQLMADYLHLYNLFEKGLSTEQIDNLNRTFEVTSKKIDAVNAKIKDAKINKANDILFDLDTGSFESSINKIKTSLKQMSAKDMARGVGEVDRAIEALDSSFNDLNLAKESKDVDKICQSYEEYVRVLKKAQNLLSTQKTVVANDRLEDKKKALLSRMNLWQQEHSAARSFNKEIDALKSKLESCNEVELDRISAEFREITQQAKLAGKATSSWGDKIKHQFQEYSVYLSTASLILYGVQGMRSMYDNVVKVDSAMTELKKVTDETASSYETFLTKAAKRSVELGTSLDAYISSTADFSRLGYEFEDAQHLSEVANIYAVVGDEIADIGVATESVISTLTAFKDEIEDPMEIIDKFNKVGNTEAISSGGIGEALKRSASSLQAANATLDESIALITAANTVVQNSEKVGRFMPTIKMAISVKLLRRTRPRKDFIGVLTYIN